MHSNQRQVGGSHYGGKAVQHWDWAVVNFGPGYLAAAVTKYVARWRQKDGRRDLEKAIHYLEKLIEVHAAGTPYPPVREGRGMDALILEYKLGPREISVCSIMAAYRGPTELAVALEDLHKIIKAHFVAL